MYCFIRGSYKHYSEQQMEEDRFVSLRNKKRKYSLSGSVYLLQGENTTGISAKWLLNFQEFELWRVNLYHMSQELV